MLEKLFFYSFSLLSYSNKENMSPLELAIHLELAGVVDILCRHGADVNHKDKFGNTVLFRALKSKQLDMALTLVNNKSNKKRKKRNKNTKPIVYLYTNTWMIFVVFFSLFFLLFFLFSLFFFHCYFIIFYFLFFRLSLFMVSQK